MNNKIGIIGLVLAFLALLVAILNWLSPFSPVGPSPVTIQMTQTVIPFDTPFDFGSGDTIDVPPTAYIPPNTKQAPQEPNVIPTKSPIPRINNFSACKDPCNGSNSATTFPSAIKKIYLEWDYENIPYGAHYIRKWTMNGKEWIKYDCTWTGNEDGRESVKLTEPKGLHSGTWKLTILVDENVLLNEQINVSGNWDYWDPAGTVKSCYGTTD